MTRPNTRLLVVPAVLLLAGCAGPQLSPPPQLPQRTVLYYDYVGAWAATEGNECAERVDLSNGVFLAIGPDPAGERGTFRAEYFFMLEPEDQVAPTLGRLTPDGGLALDIKTRGAIDGRQADITYRLTLEPMDVSHVLVKRLEMDVAFLSESGTEARSIDLLGDAAVAERVPDLAIGGRDGICLRRM